MITQVKDSKEKYLDAKYVVDHPDEYDYRDVASAQKYCEGYQDAFVNCDIESVRFKGIRISTDKEIISDSIAQKKICEKLYVFMKDPNREPFGRVWTEVYPETVKRLR